MISAALILFTACSKDEKTGAFQTGKFEISQAGSPYAAIELTENGEYIVTKNTVSVKADADNADLDDVWLYGKFSYLDGRYILRGFGELTVKDLGNGRFTLAVNPTVGQPVVVDAQLGTKIEQTRINNLLCRHWNLKDTKITLDLNGLKLDLSSFGALLKLLGLDNSNLSEDFDGLIITESGSYAVVYDGHKVNVGSWQWQNAADGSLVCNWDNSYASWFKDYHFSGATVVAVTEGENGAPDQLKVSEIFDSTLKKDYIIFSNYKTYNVTVEYTFEEAPVVEE